MKTVDSSLLITAINYETHYCFPPFLVDPRLLRNASVILSALEQHGSHEKRKNHLYQLHEAKNKGRYRMGLRDATFARLGFQYLRGSCVCKLESRTSRNFQVHGNTYDQALHLQPKIDEMK